MSQLSGVTGAVTAPGRKSSGSPSIWEVLNPLNPGTIPRNAQEIAKKAGSAAGFAASSSKQEKLGEEIGKGAKKGVEEAAEGPLSGLMAILQRAGLTLVLALAGLALVVYGVMVAVRPRERALSLPGGG